MNTVSWSIPKYCCTGHQVYLKFFRNEVNKNARGISTSRESYVADLIKPNDRFQLGYSK